MQFEGLLQDLERMDVEALMRDARRLQSPRVLRAAVCVVQMAESAATEEVEL